MFDQLVQIICNYVEVEPENVRPQSRFMEDLGFTSFDFMSMLGEIEDEFDVEIEQEKAADIRTVQEAVDYLSGRRRLWDIIHITRSVRLQNTRTDSIKTVLLRAIRQGRMK